MTPSQAKFLAPSWTGKSTPFQVVEPNLKLSEEKAVVPALPRVPIPRHLTTSRPMRTKNTTKPVRPNRGGRRPNKGWRDITAGNVVDYGHKAWNLAKHLATLINVEDKKFDVDGSGGTTITSTPTVVNLSNIAQGNDYNNRSGDSILGQAIEFRAIVVSNAAVAGNLIRVMVVVDRENHGADIVMGDVLQGGTSPLIQPVLATSANRFEILYDELISAPTPGVGLATSGSSTTYLSTFVVPPALIRKWNKHIKYTSSAGADASNWENAIFLLAVSNQASNGPTLNYTFRLHFTDN